MCRWELEVDRMVSKDFEAEIKESISYRDSFMEDEQWGQLGIAILLGRRVTAVIHPSSLKEPFDSLSSRSSGGACCFCECSGFENDLKDILVYATSLENVYDDRLMSGGPRRGTRKVCETCHDDFTDQLLKDSRLTAHMI